ncbi:multidrug transporter [Sphingomonas sp. Leaf17]|uniref:SapC family protein n=1 Tax=Sphingomonas sp. Leaf17 TaxID=1735683 RepID=UPI0006FE369D|nr:SapC family protein [Sphingomonas sp. Leaf17]KQM67814.1 multidrug transporter [Sphingomonas sp. Leaf17]
MSDHAILTAEDHRDLRIRTERSPAYGDAVMACITVPSEFRRVQSHYPILFQLDATRDNFIALAMFGFEAGENLFLTDTGWDARYRPLAIDSQPFLVGRGPDGSDVRQVHIDMASPRIVTGAGEGMRVFDDTGRPTPYLERIADQLRALDTDYVASAGFFAALLRHDLLEPLTLDVTLDDGSKNRLVGYHVIDEDKLAALDAAAIADLHEAGHLMPIFMALASLGAIGDLVARKNRRNAHG